MNGEVNRLQGGWRRPRGMRVALLILEIQSLEVMLQSETLPMLDWLWHSAQKQAVSVERIFISVIPAEIFQYYYGFGWIIRDGCTLKTHWEDS
jgi:hypothetical protein